MTAIEQAEAWIRDGKYADALAATEALLRAQPNDTRALIVRVNAANALARFDLAIAGLRALLRLHPRHAQFRRMLASAFDHRGGARRDRGDSMGAQRDFHAAIELASEHPQAWFNLALCLRDLGQAEAARAALTRHLAFAPEDRPARLLLASLHDAEAAARYLDSLDPEAIAALDPAWLAHSAVRANRIDVASAALAQLNAQHDQATALEAIGELRLRGEAEAASTGARYVIAASRSAGAPTLRAELIDALALPAIYADAEDLQRWRQRYLDGLLRLDAAWPTARFAPCATPLRQLAHGNFLLAYQGGNDREPQARFAAVIERAAAALQPALLEPLPTPRSRRVGLLSSHWRLCTVGSYFGAWIGWLRDAGWHVHVYQLGPKRDATTDALAAQAHLFRYFETSLEEIAHTVRGDDLDLLIYPELGMDARLTPLAALRLARRQAVAWGHPVTSGYSTLDDYLTCAAMEPSDGSTHYRERLCALPGLGVDYRAPPRPAPLAPAALGLDPARPRVLVPQSLFKLHPDNDAVMASIAARLPAVQFVVFEPEYPRWLTQYRTRLNAAFEHVGRRLDEHLVVHPLGPRERFLQINLACDLMLDSLHWSGGNTAIDALSCGLPLVTCPGAQMRGRQSFAMLQRLGLHEDLVAASPASLAERVVALLSDAERRRAISRRIAERLPDLFESEQARRAFIAWAEAAAA